MRIDTNIRGFVLFVFMFFCLWKVGAQTVIIDDLSQFYPVDFYVVEDDSGEIDYVWVFGTAIVDTFGWNACWATVGVRFIVDKTTNSLRYDTTMIIDKVMNNSFNDFILFAWLGSHYFPSRRAGEVSYWGAARRAVGTGKEARIVSSRGYGIQRAIIDQRGVVDTILYYPIFSLPGYNPDGLDTTIADTIPICASNSLDTGNAQPTGIYGYGAWVSDVDYIDEDSAFYILVPESYWIYDSLFINKRREFYRHLIVKAEMEGPQVVYSSNWNIVDPLLWGGDNGWYFDWVDFVFYNIEVGNEFIYVGAAGSWWDYFSRINGGLPWWVDSFLVDSLIVAPVDSGLFVVVDANSFNGQLSFGYIYKKEAVGDSLYPWGTFSIYANTGDNINWEVLTHPVGTRWINDTILNITVTFRCVDSNAFVMMPHMWVYTAKNDTFYSIDLPWIRVNDLLQATTASIKLDVQSMSLVEFAIIDSNDGYWGYVLDDVLSSSNVLAGSYTVWDNAFRFAPSSVNIVRKHIGISSYRQHLRVTGRRFIDSGVYVPQSIEAINSPVDVLSDGRMITIVKGFNAEQVRGVNSLVFESVYDGDTLPYSFVDKVSYEFIRRGQGVWYALVLLGCPAVDSANLLSSIGVEVGDCSLGISDSMAQWGINLSDSAYVNFDGSTELGAIFTWEDGCAYEYSFSRSWIDTNFIQSVYGCGILSVDSFVPGLVYSLYDERGQLVGVSDSGVFNISIEGTYWIGVEDTQKCVYWYSDTVEVSFAREGIGLSQIMSNDDILIVGNEGLRGAELLDPSGTILDRGILDHVGRCEGKCGNREIYRYKGSHKKLQKGVYFLKVYDESGNTGIVKIVVQ